MRTGVFHGPPLRLQWPTRGAQPGPAVLRVARVRRSDGVPVRADDVVEERFEVELRDGQVVWLLQQELVELLPTQEGWGGVEAVQAAVHAARAQFNRAILPALNERRSVGAVAIQVAPAASLRLGEWLAANWDTDGGLVVKPPHDTWAVMTSAARKLSKVVGYSAYNNTLDEFDRTNQAKNSLFK